MTALKRQYNPTTATWSFEDGSGLLTDEQMIELRGIKNWAVLIARKEQMLKLNQNNQQ